MALDLVVLNRGETVDLHAEIGGELTHILFCDNNLRVLREHLCRILGKWTDVAELSHRYLVALGTQFVHCGVQMAVGGTKAHDEQFCIVLITQDFEVGHRDAVDLLLTQTSHEIVVLGVRRDGTRLVVLLQATQDVGETFATRHSPVTHALSITLIGSPGSAQFLGNIGRIDGGILVEIGQTECSRTIGDEGICEQNHGSHVFKCHLRSLVGSIKAVGWTEGCHHRHGAFAVTAEEHLQEVGLLRLRGKARSRSTTLNIEHHQRQFHDDAKVHGLRLQAYTRTRGRGHSQRTSEGSAECRSTAADFVLALYGGHAETLVLRQFVKHIGGWCDGVATQVKLQASLLGSGDETICCGFVTRNIHVAASHFLLRLNTIDIGGRAMCVVSVVIACLNHLDVGFGDGWLFGKLLTKEVESHLQVATEEPAYEADGKHVAALEHRLHIHSRVGKAVLDHRGQRAGDDAVGIDAHLLDGVFGLELSFLQILRTEAIGVYDDSGSRLSIAILCLQRGCVHRNEHIAQITRSIDLTGTYVHLISTDTCERTLRGADVGRIVGKGADTVTYGCRDRRKNVSGQLHAVTGITRETDNNTVQLLNLHNLT